MDFNKEETDELRKLSNAIRVFRTLDPNMTLVTMAAALEVAIRGSQGTNVMNLEQALDIPTPSAARQLQHLEPVRSDRTRGHGLVDSLIDPDNPKGKVRIPNNNMRDLVTKILAHVDDAL